MHQKSYVCFYCSCCHGIFSLQEIRTSVVFKICVASLACWSVLPRVSVDFRASRAIWDSQGCRDTRGLQGQWALRWVSSNNLVITKAKTVLSSTYLPVRCGNSLYFHLIGRLWRDRGAWTEGRTGKKQELIRHVGWKWKVAKFVVGLLTWMWMFLQGPPGQPGFPGNPGLPVSSISLASPLDTNRRWTLSSGSNCPFPVY